MKKLMAVGLILFAGSSPLWAQSEKHNDSVILADIILPMISKSSGTQDVPDWQALGADIRTRYGDSYVDRTVTKARIYYYFGKDWPLFSKALVHFTEAYEDKDNLQLMNKNAKMVLKYSQNPDEWKTATSWIKHAMEKDPDNGDYKDTYNALAAKIKK